MLPSDSDLPSEFWQGVEEFNRREFYACHDTLEAIWLEAIEPNKTFYQGILQVAVGCYHLSNLNWRGAAILLGEGIRRLNRYLPSYGGIDVEGLLDRSAEMLSVLQQAGEAEVAVLAAQYGLSQTGDAEESRSLELPKIDCV
jgi:uncharacterized protein